MATVFKNGLMALDMKVTGKKVRHVVEEYFTMQMEIYLSENGWTTKRTGLEFISTKTEQVMRDSGKMINSMAKGKSNGKMAAST